MHHIDCLLNTILLCYSRVSVPRSGMIPAVSCFLTHKEHRIMAEDSHHTRQPVTGVILSGGKCIRMGGNKAFLEIRRTRIIDQTAELLNAIFKQVILVTNEPLEYSYLDLEITIDLFPKNGPLVGIYTGLFYSSHTYSFITACDMPFLNRKVIEYMISLRGNYDVIIPHLHDGYHPLHALYSKRCMKFIEESIREEKLKITDFFYKAKVKDVSSQEISALDPGLDSFLNINTPEDLKKIQERTCF